eukprot:s1175_g4.t1
MLLQRSIGKRSKPKPLKTSAECIYGQFRHFDSWGEDIAKTFSIPAAKDRAGGRGEEAVAPQREGVATSTKPLNGKGWQRTGRLPGPPGASGGLAWAMQRVAAHCSSMVETLRYLVCFPILFVLALPSIMQFEFQGLAWKWLENGGVPIARKKESTPWAGPSDHLEHVQSGMGRNEVIWVHTESNFMEEPGGRDVSQDASEEVAAVVAQTPAAQLAQQLARQAGVDFRSVDSLRIARLSVLLKKHMRPISEALEFNELREACADEPGFLQLVEERLEA